MEKIRSFIAIEIGYNQKIKELFNDIRNTGAIIKLVEPKNIHITLKFLGDISDDKIKDIEKIMENSLVDVKPFKFNLEGIGVFPNQNYIKIIWIGINNSEILEKLSKRINKKIYSIIPENKHQKFIPHITIGRVKSSKNKEKILEIVDRYKNYKFAEILVDKIKLKKSELTSKGPIYSDLIKLDI
jgi:2'-5' RNA ligase